MVAPVQVERLCSVLWEGLGIAREEIVLSSAAKGLEELLAGDLTPWERNRALLGKAMVSSAPIIARTSPSEMTRSFKRPPSQCAGTAQ